MGGAILNWLPGLYKSVITNVKKSINNSDQIPAEFEAIPDKRKGEGAESAPALDLLGLTNYQCFDNQPHFIH